MRMRTLSAGLGLALALAVAVPLHAAEKAPEGPSAASISAAKPVIDRIWPLGTYRRMMDGTMSGMMDQMFASMFDMKAVDLAGAVDPSGKAAREAGNATMGEMIAKSDPHYRERMKITMDVMMQDMIPMFERIEPGIRESMATIYARKYSVTQLNEMNAFFATPTGKAYAENSMLVFMDPEIMKSVQSFLPEFMRSMPGMLKKVEAATAHLPKPKSASSSDAASDAADAAVDAVNDAAAGTASPEALWELSENWAPEHQSAYGRATDQFEKALEEMDSVRAKATAEAKARLSKK